ncbi:hypothetical protein DVH24_022542 [Malus domestica]|uniref:Uncharacterized protein n=1 Tax=Malus domestica TaxID=3750 RepID=A0A498KKZ8_MALDO|nr:hypothetical protein DVH24_022542 [Malus domestica]
MWHGMIEIFHCDRNTNGIPLINLLTRISHHLYSDTWCIIPYFHHNEKSLMECGELTVHHFGSSLVSNSIGTPKLSEFVQEQFHDE